MNSTSIHEITATTDRIKLELAELKNAHAHTIRLLRLVGCVGVAVATGLVTLGVGTPRWLSPIHARGPFATAPAASFSPSPAVPTLIEVGRYYISPNNISHSYISNGQRHLFFAGGQHIPLSNDEADVIRRLVVGFPVGLPIEQPPGVPGNAFPPPGAEPAPAAAAPGGGFAVPGAIGTSPVAPAAPADSPPAPR